MGMRKEGRLNFICFFVVKKFVVVLDLDNVVLL